MQFPSSPNLSSVNNQEEWLRWIDWNCCEPTPNETTSPLLNSDILSLSSSFSSFPSPTVTQTDQSTDIQWSQQEDQNLIEAIRTIGKYMLFFEEEEWTYVSQSIGNRRTSYECRQHFQTIWEQQIDLQSLIKFDGIVEVSNYLQNKHLVFIPPPSISLPVYTDPDELFNVFSLVQNSPNSDTDESFKLTIKQLEEILFE